jgi:hypothetical protein
MPASAQRSAITGHHRPPGKKARVAPGRDVFHTLLRRVEPAALAAVLNEWLQGQHGQLLAATDLSDTLISLDAGHASHE